MNFHHTVTVCTCEHLKRVHVVTKQQPAGPCTSCLCTSFTPEKQCSRPSCGHGKKAHKKGRCHECGCPEFTS